MKNLLGKLSLRQSGGKDAHHRVSWTELFFDLAFVVAVARLSHALNGEATTDVWHQALSGGLMILISWMQFVFYCNRFDTSDGFHQLAMYVQMFGVMVMASGFRDLSDSIIDEQRFFYGLIISRVFLIGLYVRACILAAEARPLAIGISGFYVLTGLGYQLAFDFHYWLLVPIACDLLLPIFLRPILAKSTAALANSHLVERFGLLVILIFGESLAAVVNHSHPIGSAVTHWVFIAVAFVAVVCCWRTYMANVDEKAVQRRFGLVIAWELTHTVFVTLLIGFSIALHHILKDPHYAPLLMATYGGAIGCIGLLHLWCHLAQPDRTALAQTAIRLASATLLIGVAWMDFAQSQFAPVVVVAIFGSLQVITDELL
jgi:low temperature requirement protein LtrA